MLIRRAVIRSSLTAAFLVGVVGLTGCIPVVDTPPASSPTVGPTTTTSPSAGPSPSDGQQDSAISVSIPCGSVISAQRMYDFNPNFALLTSFTPDSGSVAARAAGDDGTVCRWVHETSSATIDVSIARPASAELQSILATAAGGTPVNDVGDEAFFTVIDGIGTTQAFTGPFWVTVASEYFSSPFDAIDLVNAAMTSIR